MSAQHFEFNQQRLRKDGVRLARLAAFGEIMLVAAIIAIPIALFAIGGPLVPTEDFLSFTLKAYFTSDTSHLNLYGVLKALVAILVLDRTRRLGVALSGTEPLGPRVATHLRGLMATMSAAIITMCFSVEPTYHGVNQAFRTEWDWSLNPLYLGAIVLLGLLIVERIIRHANLLQAEVQEFV